MAFASKEWVKDLLNKVFKQSDIYSTTERRIGTWIDGKALYRKVYLWGYGPNKTTVSRTFSQIGIPNGSAITKIWYLCRWNSNSNLTGYCAMGADTGGASVWIENNVVYFVCPNADGSANYYTFIIEYTKTS